jgi:hypothetical protein
LQAQVDALAQPTIQAERGPIDTGRPSSPPAVLAIEPPRGWVGLNGSDIWRYRELLDHLTWRDLKGRCKQPISKGSISC